MSHATSQVTCVPVTDSVALGATLNSPAQIQRVCLLLLLLSSFTVGCSNNLPSASLGQGSTESTNLAAPTSTSEQAAPTELAEATPVVQNPDSVPSRAAPQLVKTIDWTMTVESVEETVKKVTAIARQQQGDLLGLQDQIPINARSHRTASLQLRVPQANLDTTLDALSALGNTQRQSLRAEDVSNQLVDLQARLRNLQRTEEMLLEIMERSGGVGDVLKVAQELGNVRNSIEQVDAQLKNLQNQVAYSTINLSLKEAIAATPFQRSTPVQLRETWESATYSFSRSTTALLQFSIWLLVYSPYWLVLAGLTFGLWHLRRAKTETSAQNQPPRTR
jgi:hypothetical protein